MYSVYLKWLFVYPRKTTKQMPEAATTIMIVDLLQLTSQLESLTGKLTYLIHSLTRYSILTMRDNALRYESF